MMLLDASALLAYLSGEPGWERVEPFLLSGDAAMSTVNQAEVLGKLMDYGMAREAAQQTLEVLDLHSIPFDVNESLETASLRSATRSLGLSLGDRACLATARLHQLSVLTADQPWLALKGLLNLDIHLLRNR